MLMYLFLNSEVYLKYTLSEQKSGSINEVFLKYKQITFLFFSVLYFIYTSFFFEIHLKYTSTGLQGSEVQMKYT